MLYASGKSFVGSQQSSHKGNVITETTNSPDKTPTQLKNSQRLLKRSIGHQRSNAESRLELTAVARVSDKLPKSNMLRLASNSPARFYGDDNTSNNKSVNQSKILPNSIDRKHKKSSSVAIGTPGLNKTG